MRISENQTGNYPFSGRRNRTTGAENLTKPNVKGYSMTDAQQQRAEFDTLNDCYKFLKKYRYIRQSDSDSAWIELIDAADSIGNRNAGTPLGDFTRAVMIAALEYIGTRSKGA